MSLRLFIEKNNFKIHCATTMDIFLECDELDTMQAIPIVFHDFVFHYGILIYGPRDQSKQRYCVSARYVEIHIHTYMYILYIYLDTYIHYVCIQFSTGSSDKFWKYCYNNFFQRFAFCLCIFRELQRRRQLKHVFSFFYQFICVPMSWLLFVCLSSLAKFFVASLYI